MELLGIVFMLAFAIVFALIVLTDIFKVSAENILWAIPVACAVYYVAVLS